MSEPWTFEKLNSFITDQVEESLTLDYKAAGALHREKRAEITKDVSAMANSAGGLIIYGIREHSDKAKAHLPERIDPVKRSEYSKEWLEHIIQNIRPRIDSVPIHSISIPTDPDHVAYIVEVPQSTTAHQATDLKYYRRYNFESVPMQDHEIRDVMGRRQHPVIDVLFYVEYATRYTYTRAPSIPGSKTLKAPVTTVDLKADAVNVGRLVAHHVTAKLYIPKGILNASKVPPGKDVLLAGTEYDMHTGKNLVRDFVGYAPPPFPGGGKEPMYSAFRIEPLLPELTLQMASWEINIHGFQQQRTAGSRLVWEASADEAPKRTGEISLTDLKIIDTRKPEDIER